MKIPVASTSRSITDLRSSSNSWDYKVFKPETPKTDQLSLILYGGFLVVISLSSLSLSLSPSLSVLLVGDFVEKGIPVAPLDGRSQHLH